MARSRESLKLWAHVIQTSLSRDDGGDVNVPMQCWCGQVLYLEDGGCHQEKLCWSLGQDTGPIC